MKKYTCADVFFEWRENRPHLGNGSFSRLIDCDSASLRSFF